MIALSNGTGLAVAAIVPVVVVGWAILFSVEAARQGPAWAVRHLRAAGGLFAAGLGLAVVTLLVVRPVWVGLSAAYPLTVVWILIAGRSRQLAMVDRAIGFGEVDAGLRGKLLARLRQGLWVVGGLALVIGATLASIGVVHGWIVAALAPVAVLAIIRSKRPGLGAVSPPSL